MFPSISATHQHIRITIKRGLCWYLVVSYDTKPCSLPSCEENSIESGAPSVDFYFTYVLYIQTSQQGYSSRKGCRFPGFPWYAEATCSSGLPTMSRTKSALFRDSPLPRMPVPPETNAMPLYRVAATLKSKEVPLLPSSIETQLTPSLAYGTSRATTFEMPA